MSLYFIIYDLNPFNFPECTKLLGIRISSKKAYIFKGRVEYSKEHPIYCCWRHDNLFHPRITKKHFASMLEIIHFLKVFFEKDVNVSHNKRFQTIFLLQLKLMLFFCLNQMK